MVHTIKHAIRNTLEDLRKNCFLTFCHQLRDRREEPRVRCSEVEDKTVLEITDLLVSTFTEPKALQVTLDILRQINCNNEAETLYLQTKACVDNGDPVLRKTSSGALEMQPSQEARNYAADRRPLGAARQGDSPVKKPEEVEAEAKACVVSEGGDPCKKRLVLSRFTIQFGQYKDKTFKWLLENDVSYVAMLVARHQKEQEDSVSQSPLMVNKVMQRKGGCCLPSDISKLPKVFSFKVVSSKPICLSSDLFTLPAGNYRCSYTQCSFTHKNNWMQETVSDQRQHRSSPQT